MAISDAALISDVGEALREFRPSETEYGWAVETAASLVRRYAPNAPDAVLLESVRRCATWIIRKSVIHAETGGTAGAPGAGSGITTKYAVSPIQRAPALRRYGDPVPVEDPAGRGDLMRWPWQKREKRDSGGSFSDAVVRLIEAQAAGKAADSASTAAVEAASGALSRALAAAKVEGPPHVREAVTAFDAGPGGPRPDPVRPVDARYRRE